MANSNKPTIVTAGKDMEQPAHSYTAGGNVKWYDYFGHALKLKKHLPYDLDIPLTGTTVLTGSVNPVGNANFQAAA